MFAPELGLGYWDATSDLRVALITPEFCPAFVSKSEHCETEFITGARVPGTVPRAAGSPAPCLATRHSPLLLRAL